MRTRVVCSITVWLVAFAAAAQQTIGAEAPAQSFSLQDDGTSLGGNPAGLGFVRGLEADFLHNGYYAEGHQQINALYFAGGVGPLTLGLGFDWRSPIYERRTSVGGALRLGQLSLGAVHRGFSVLDISSWDFGGLFRPARFLSLGAAALDANRPGSNPRRWQLSAAIRPIGEIVDLAADLRWSECTNNPTAPICGLDHKDWFFTAQARLFRGVTLLGQVGLLDGSQTTGLVGLQLDFSHLGVAYAPSFGGDDVRDTYRIRASTESWPSAAIPVSRGVEIDLKRALAKPQRGVSALVFGGSTHDPLQLTLETMRRLSRDPSVSAVVFRTGGLGLGLGRAAELRAGIENLKASGKKVIFYLESGGDLEYSVALPADRIYAAPQAILLVNGFSASALFAAAGLDKLGVKAEFFRVGAYKNAPDLFTRSSMSGEQREVETSILDDVYGRYVRRIAEARRLDEAKVRALLDVGILKPREAVQAGLIDGLVYPDQLEEEAGKVLGRKANLKKIGVERPEGRELRWGGKPTIGVVRVTGDIVRGEGTRDPFGAVEVAGSDAISRRIRRLADDPSVAALVVRIDSPGGDGNASDLIWRELVRARKEKRKPVIASMGDVAASGGYYVAAGADEIFAEPTTITGSIGVFIGHFDASELFGKLGLRLETVKRGQSADLFMPNRELTDSERKTLQAWVDDFYDTFVDRVAEARNLTRQQVDAVARGRVWTGAQALSRGLVDRLGGFEDALVEAKRRAGLPPDAEVEMDDAIPLEVGFGDFAGVSTLDAVPMNLGARTVRALRLLGEPGTVRAALPFDLEVQ